MLLKPGKLTDDEYELMKKHTTIGYEALRVEPSASSARARFLRHALEIACLAPRTMGRQRLSEWPRGRGHSGLRPPDGGRRRLRRPGQQAGLQAVDAARAGGGDHRGGPRHAVRSRRGRRLSRAGAGVPQHRPHLRRLRGGAACCWRSRTRRPAAERLRNPAPGSAGRRQRDQSRDHVQPAIFGRLSRPGRRERPGGARDSTARAAST